MAGPLRGGGGVKGRAIKEKPFFQRPLRELFFGFPYVFKFHFNSAQNLHFFLKIIKNKLYIMTHYFFEMNRN